MLNFVSILYPLQLHFQLKMSLNLKLFGKTFKLGVDLAQIYSCFVKSLCQLLFAWCNLRICPGLGTDLAQRQAKSVPNTSCLVQSVRLAWTWHRVGLSLCQVCAKHFLLGKISSIGMDLTRTWAFFVPSLYQTLHASYNS